MLSNPPSASSLHSRQRLHRRQNSTPTAFEAVKIAPLPNFRYHDQQQQQQRSHVSHRRGLSLDTRQLQLQPSSATATTRQDLSTVSNTTTNNPGLSTTPQHVLRETQQQRAARPGPSQPSNNSNNTHRINRSNRSNTINNHRNTPSRGHSRNSSISSINHFGLDEENNFLISPHGTPHSQRFVNLMPTPTQMQDLGMSFDPYMSPMNLMMKKSQSGYDTAPGPDFELFTPDSALSTPTFMTFAEASPAGSHQGWISEGEATNSHSRRTSRRISNGILDRVSKFENMGQGSDSTATDRPMTPSGQNDNMYYPPTPMETPHDRIVKHNQARPNRFSDDYDESMEETIKPVRGNRNAQQNSGIFQEMRQQAEAMAQSGHQRTDTISTTYTESGLSAADFMDMADMNQFIKMEGDFEDLPTDNLDMSSNLSHDSAPVHPHMAAFTMTGAFDQKPHLQAIDLDSQETVVPGKSSTRSSRRGSPHRRTDSLASIVSAASISSINVEETKTDTGVTLEEIATYIDGPDAEAKWTCTYESCGKKFGRKENIKSHVQTHLNDRQYRCPTCKKCFVRQHDLKRHAKIHTGIKPYPCECGNSFARHDALTRHRQRGMCIGAFDGVVRKVVKRGRPRKHHRPDMDERREKSDRTRRKNKAAASAEAAAAAGRATATSTPSSGSSSSQSGYSDSSAANSPANGNDFDGVLDDAPFPDMDMVDMGDDTSATSAALGLNHQPNGQSTTTTTLTPASLSAISSAFMPTPSPFPNHPITSVSPEQITASAPSPSTMSNYSHADHHPGLPLLPASPAKSTTSTTYTHNNQPPSPPELSASSSSPPPTTQHQHQPPRYFDISDLDSTFDPDASGSSDHSIGLGTTAAAHAAAASCGGGGGGGNLSGLYVHDDMLLYGDGRGGDMMMGPGAKYFEDDDAVALFTTAGGEGVDVFFGSG